jgi:hypothetical protein
LRNPLCSDTGSQKLLNLSSKEVTGASRKRTEQSANAFYRLFKEEVQPEIERDFARQTDGVSQLAHRNRYIAKKFKEASDDVKELVEKNRLKAGEGERKPVVWADAASITEDEIERRNKALRMSEYVYPRP